MTFGEVIHKVTQHTGWPEPVRGIASLLSSLHCPDRPSNENLSASSSMISEPLASHETPAPESYTARDFQILIHSTAAGLSALAELPHYGGKRSTVPLWSQLLHALANTLSPDVLILEEAPFIMPRAQNVSCQPLNLIDGHATLLVAHGIFAAPRTHSDRPRTITRNEEDQGDSMRPIDQDEPMCSTEDESMCSADSDSCDGSIDSLDLPLQAHMLRSRGRHFCAVVPVLLVADSCNIVPLLCSALYQRHVWGIHQPVVGLCCSSTGTIATAIFGWLDSNQSEEGRMPTAHLALAADFRSDPLLGVFDFTDTNSAISLAQFVLGLRTHFEDIKGATLIEAVDSLTPFHWRSDVPDFKTQSWAQSDERVACWTHQTHVQRSYSPSPPIINEPPPLKNSNKASSYSNSRFAALSDNGLNDKPSITNWLFERHACTIGRIEIRSEDRANKAKINAMVKLYDEMTAFTWSDQIKRILRTAKVDEYVQQIREELCDTNDGPNCQSSETDSSSLEDVEFISSRLSALLHAVNGARNRNVVAKSSGANEADRRHEWDSLLLNFFQSVAKEQHAFVLLERQLNLARNLAVDDSSFATTAVAAAREYQHLCNEQHLNFDRSSPGAEQFRAALDQAARFYDNIMGFDKKNVADDKIETHSSKDPVTGICDAILVTPYSGGATAMLQGISSCDKQSSSDEQSSNNKEETFRESFLLVQDPKPEKLDASEGETSHQIKKPVTRGSKSKSNKSLTVPTISKTDRYLLQNPFLYHPDGNPATQKKETMPSKDTSSDEPTRGTDILLPLLIAEYKKDTSGISAAMNQMRVYQVSAVTFLSELGITDQSVYGLVVSGTLGAITMAWKTNKQIYVMERNVRHYDITDPLQALQFVSILPRLARHGEALRSLIKGQPSVSDVKPWSMLHQREEDKKRATEAESEERAIEQAESEQEVAGGTDTK